VVVDFLVIKENVKKYLLANLYLESFLGIHGGIVKKKLKMLRKKLLKMLVEVW
jgi:hypothetical protein